MKFDTPRKLAFIRADEAVEGDLLMEPINACSTAGRITYREDGRINRVANVRGDLCNVDAERAIQLGWRTPYGEQQYADLLPHRPITVIRINQEMVK